MGSGSRSPRARQKFGFSSPLTRRKKDRVTTDDILESLTRQAELRQKLEESNTVRLEEIAETEEMNRFQELNPEPASAPVMTRNRSLEHLAFVIVLLGGLIVISLYSSVSKRLDLATLNGIIQKSGILSIFANQAEVGIIGLAAVVGALWIRHRRRASSQHLIAI